MTRDAVLKALLTEYESAIEWDIREDPERPGTIIVELVEGSLYRPETETEDEVAAAFLNAWDGRAAGIQFVPATRYVKPIRPVGVPINRRPSRFDRPDKEWQVELREKIIEPAGIELPTWLCNAEGPGGVVCDLPDGHKDDHSAPAKRPARDEPGFETFTGIVQRHARTRGAREFGGARKAITAPRDGDRVKWPAMCTSTIATTMGRLHCRLPRGHAGSHACGPEEWTDG